MPSREMLLPSVPSGSSSVVQWVPLGGAIRPCPDSRLHCRLPVSNCACFTYSAQRSLQRTIASTLSSREAASHHSAHCAVLAPASQYYHFLIDFAPRMMYALDAASCANQDSSRTSTLYVPTWSMIHGQVPDKKFTLDGPQGMTSRPAFEAIFSPYRLSLVPLANETQFEGLHATRVPFISSNESLWSDQPIEWLSHFRRRVRARMGAAPPAVRPFATSESMIGPIVVIRRSASPTGHCSGACRRSLPSAFFEGARAFGLRSKLPIEVVELEKLDLASQVRLFARASATVALHGGGEANLVFMDPGSLVVEIFIPIMSSVRLLLCYQRLAKKMGLHYVLETHPADAEMFGPMMWNSGIEQTLMSHLRLGSFDTARTRLTLG